MRTAIRDFFFSVEGKVIIIIGGDDNYKNKDEEDRVVISRWARMKVQSQFKEEFLDGRKSFVFSWNKNHREIHEEALRHYFDLAKKEQKFEYQPKLKQREVVKVAQTSSERTSLQEYKSMDEQRGREGIGSSNSSSAEQKREDFSAGRSRSADEARKQSSCSSPHNAEQTTDDYSFGSTTGMAAKSKETPSASAGRTRITGKGLRANLVHWYRVKKNLRVSFHKLEKVVLKMISGITGARC